MRALQRPLRQRTFRSWRIASGWSPRSGFARPAIIPRAILKFMPRIIDKKTFSAAPFEYGAALVYLLRRSDGSYSLMM